jgi:opacity protein-like surface antigen
MRNPKSQALNPNKFQNPNVQNGKRRRVWILIIGIYLGFGVWCLGFSNLVLAANSLDPTLLGMGARALSMGRSCVANPADINSIFVNPANAAKVDDWAVTSMYTSLLEDDIKYTIVGAAKKARIGSVEGTFALSYMAGMSSGIEPTTRDADSRVINNGSNFDYNNSVINLVYGKEIRKDLSLGGTLKLFSKNFSGQASGSGIDMDLGLLYAPQEKLNLGLVMQNFLPMGLSWSTGAKEDVAMQIKAGLDYKINDYVQILADADLSPMALHAGVEWKPSSILALRAGLENSTTGNSIKTTNLSAGLGLSFHGVNFDYAYFKDGNLDANTTHFFTISFQPEVKKVSAVTAPPVAPVIAPSVMPKVAPKTSSNTVKPASKLK